MSILTGEPPGFIARHETAVADHIGCQDRCETAFHEILLPERSYPRLVWISIAAAERSNVAFWQIVLQKSLK
jgi:hypothetical protein